MIKYGYLYRMFDERVRNKRIVFEWLTEKEKAKAMIEEIPSIKSIIFQKDAEDGANDGMVQSFDRHRSIRA